MNFLWVKLVLKILLKWWVFICVWGWLKVQLFVDVCVFVCLSLLFQSCLKNEVPHYFFSQKVKCLIISSEKMRRLIISSEKMKCLMISSEKMRFLMISLEKLWFFSEEIMRNRIFFWRNNEALHFFWRNNEAPHFFEEIMRRLIFWMPK